MSKSTVSRVVADLRPGTVWIRDDLRAFAPADARVHLGPGSTHRAAGALAAAYLAMGARRALVDYCFLNALHVERLLEALGVAVPVHLVTLRAPLAVVQHRERTRTGREPLGDAVDASYREIEAAPCFTVRLDTDGVDPAELAARVEQLVGTGAALWPPWRAAGVGRSDRLAVGAGPHAARGGSQ